MGRKQGKVRTLGAEKGRDDPREGELSGSGGGDAPIRNIDFLNLNLSLHIFFFSSCFLFPSTIDFTICFLLTSKAGDGS